MGRMSDVQYIAKDLGQALMIQNNKSQRTIMTLHMQTNQENRTKQQLPHIHDLVFEFIVKK